MFLRTSKCLLGKFLFYTLISVGIKWENLDVFYLLRKNRSQKFLLKIWLQLWIWENCFWIFDRISKQHDKKNYHKQNFTQKWKSVIFTHSLIPVIRCNFRNAKWTDLQKNSKMLILGSKMSHLSDSGTIRISLKIRNRHC